MWRGMHSFLVLGIIQAVLQHQIEHVQAAAAFTVFSA
jgi:hypothetical protein